MDTDAGVVVSWGAMNVFEHRLTDIVTWFANGVVVRTLH